VTIPTLRALPNTSLLLPPLALSWRSAAGLQVQPLDFKSLFGALTGNGQTRQPRVIQLNVGQRQLEQVMVDIINGRVANA
jgi:hypothetical protein